MGRAQADFIFATLRQEEFDIGVKIVLAFIDIDKGWDALIFRNHRAFHDSLGQHGDEEPTKERRATFFEQVFGRVD